MSAWLEEIKRQLIERHSLERIANPDRSRKQESKLAQGIKDVPVKKFMEQIEYLQNEFLPAVEKKRGKDSADYEFFSGVVSSLVWAIMLCDRYDTVQNRLVSEHVQAQLLREHAVILERELSKFETLEDLFFTDGLNRYADIIVERAKSMQQRKK